MVSHNLPPESYTARRLEHATPQHLHETTCRTFIGPIPKGWLKSHRKEWYRHYIRLGRRRVPTFTAAEPVATATTNTSPVVDDNVGEDRPRASSQLIGDSAASTTSLLHSQHASAGASPKQTIPSGPEPAEAGRDGPRPNNAFRLDGAATKLSTRKVRFSEASKLQLRARAQRLAARSTLRNSRVKDGEMLKVEKMLVRVDITQQSLRDYDEKISQGVETKSMDKWREFMVVCRSHVEEDALAVLQFYKTRVIAISETDQVKKSPKAEILMSNRRAKVNMFSALDKTLCVWTTTGTRTTIYYLRAQSTATAVEWFTFLRGMLGHRRPNTLRVNIPDLSVSLRIDDPFGAAKTSTTLEEAAEGDDDALIRALSDESGVAGNIVARCIEMLKDNPEWADVLKAWSQYDRIGLAWKRYDRLEWIYGAVEEKMYGTIAMARTHDLELRPKDHYPVSTKLRDGTRMAEPSPIEGFLIRLTSATGQERSMRRMQFKRLYFSSQNQYLLFTRPSKANPPPPPRMAAREDSNIPSTKELIDSVPLAYDVEPYPLDGKHITWLDTEGVKSATDHKGHDQQAADEAARNVAMLTSSDGFINLCEVQRVRRFHRGAAAPEVNVEDGSDVDFHEEAPNEDNRRNDEETDRVNEDRIFELVLKSGLIVRLQAYNKAARIEWIKRLRQLVEYWTQRIREDIDVYKSTREQNFRALGIDERAETLVGQFAYKWEVSKSFASPVLYNLCGIAECRPIHISGILYRKPRKHTTFTRCQVILSHGHLLLFQDSARKRNGQRTAHIHHERIGAMSLQGCYLYSGVLSENDLLYQNRTFDSNTPGHHGLPRVYLEDGWTSTDEDAMTTFVIWHAKSKSWFRSARYIDDVKTQEDSQGDSSKMKTKLTRVSQLGATGRSVVFKARSRAERDHWVLAIQVEIERMSAQNDEVRIVNDSSKPTENK